MKERPILFSAPMMQAILAGNKTQTRRVVKWPLMDKSQWFELDESYGVELANPSNPIDHLCRYGKIGDQLWVRETFCPIYPQDKYYNNGRPIEYDYKASYKHGDRLGDSIGIKKKWLPSIHMPRRASRIQLEITNIRVERLFDLSEDDAMAEGCNGVLWVNDGLGSKTPPKGYGLLNSYPTAKHWFACLWDEINGSGSWSANPWVWVIEFKPIKTQFTI